MKRSGWYYTYYVLGGLFLLGMVDVIVHVALLWSRLSGY